MDIAPDLLTLGFEGKEICRGQLVTKFDTSSVSESHKILNFSPVFQMGLTVVGNLLHVSSYQESNIIHTEH